jgi:hypothetical protein
MRGNGDIRGTRTSPYHGARKSRNPGAGERTKIAGAAYADRTLGGSRISRGGGRRGVGLSHGWGVGSERAEEFFKYSFRIV